MRSDDLSRFPFDTDDESAICPERRQLLGFGLLAAAGFAIAGASLASALKTKGHSKDHKSHHGSHPAKAHHAARKGSATRTTASHKKIHRERTITLYHTATSESLRTVYWADGQYLSASFSEINHLLRDHHNNYAHRMDPRLVDLLYILQHKTGRREPFHVVCGYRSPSTNAQLRENHAGVGKHSMHLYGKAVDIRPPGGSLSDLKRAALAMQVGGVGYYPGSNFLHVDTGAIRTWYG
ncbi:MAG: DUF882 domain-containing protein [Pseudomonadota bacterium]